MKTWFSRFRDFFVRPSTRAFWQEGRRTPGFSLFDWLHGYVYGRWPYLYIGIGTGEHWLARRFGPLVNQVGRLLAPGSPAGSSQEDIPPGSAGYSRADLADPDKFAPISFADTYHGKVVPLGAATQLITVNEEIRLPNLEQVIPYARARDIVLKNPDHIVVLDCPCRVSRKDPCLPLDVCLVVGEPFASFVSEHHPQRSRWISPEEAVEILRAEDERGHVHHAFFKDAMLGRFYAICNCCACCCGAMHAQRNGTPMLASSGFVNQVDEFLCIGCGTCLDFCQFGALSMNEFTVHVDPAACMGCGVCASKCDQQALSLLRDPGRGQPLEILELLQAASQVFSEN